MNVYGNPAVRAVNRLNAVGRLYLVVGEEHDQAFLLATVRQAATSYFFDTRFVG